MSKRDSSGVHILVFILSAGSVIYQSKTKDINLIIYFMGLRVCFMYDIIFFFKSEIGPNCACLEANGGLKAGTNMQ